MITGEAAPCKGLPKKAFGLRKWDFCKSDTTLDADQLCPSTEEYIDNGAKSQWSYLSVYAIESFV